MSRTSRPRTIAATGLTLGFAATTVFLAPGAFAAELAAPTAPATVTPGVAFEVKGTGCAVVEDDYPATVAILTDVEDVYGDVDVDVDGSWTATLTFPEGTAAGAQPIWAACDNMYYGDAMDYPEISVNVAGPGAIRGAAANTPGTVNKDTDRVAVPGEKITRVIAGFKPFEVVTLVLHSEPIVLGTFTADANGVVTATFTLPAGLAVGEHTLVFDGNMGTYYQEALTVEAAAATKPASSGLAYTGASIAMPLALGGGLLALGGGALVVSRRRSAGATQA